MSGNLFYQKPVLLNRERHRWKKIAPARDLNFAQKTNSLYLAGAEFGNACKEYPIVFTMVESGAYIPVALLGLRTEENLLIDATGAWQGRYLPAYLRRYPFALFDLDGGQKGVCIDEAYPGLNDKTGEALFDRSGANTPFLQKTVAFLNEYQAQCLRTEEFCQRLKDAGLFKQIDTTATLYDGSSFSLNGLMVVDEDKLLALGDKQALELFRAGELAWVYAHLMSLSNMQGLVERLATVRRAETAAA